MSTLADLAAHAGQRIRCRRLVITTGTFLRGVIHIGSQSRPAGRMPSTAASEAASSSAQAPVAAARATDAADETAALAAGGAPHASASGWVGWQGIKHVTRRKLSQVAALNSCAVDEDHQLPQQSSTCQQLSAAAQKHGFFCLGSQEEAKPGMVRGCCCCRHACKDPGRPRLLLSRCPAGARRVLMRWCCCCRHACKDPGRPRLQAEPAQDGDPAPHRRQDG